MKQSIVRALLLGATVASLLPATPAISKKEANAECITCHVKKGSKALNKVGGCYKDSKDLKTCQTATPSASISSFLARHDNGK